jgi:hypothetical protein
MNEICKNTALAQDTRGQTQNCTEGAGMSNVVEGFFLSYWDSGAVFKAPCCVNPESKEVFSIMYVGHPGDNDELINEAVEIDELEYDVTNIDEIIELESRKDAYYKLLEVKKQSGYWYSTEGKSLEKALKSVNPRRKGK